MKCFRELLGIYLSHTKWRELVRFALVGLLATAIHYAIYIVLVKTIVLQAVWWESVAYAIGYVTAFFCNLWLTARFTFRSELNIRRSGGFAVSHAINFCNHLLLFNFFRWAGMSEALAPIPSIVIATLVNFFIIRFVFKSKYFESKK